MSVTRSGLSSIRLINEEIGERVGHVLTEWRNQCTFGKLAGNERTPGQCNAMPGLGGIQRAVAVDENGAAGRVDFRCTCRFQPAPPFIAVFIMQQRDRFQIARFP